MEEYLAQVSAKLLEYVKNAIAQDKWVAYLPPDSRHSTSIRKFLSVSRHWEFFMQLMLRNRNHRGRV